MQDDPYKTQPLEPPAVSTPVVLYVLAFAVFTVFAVALVYDFLGG